VTSDWRHRAACTSENIPDQWFPKSDIGPYWATVIDEAKAVCRRCPVRDQCLQWALTTGQDTGIWGGLTEQERRDLHHRAAA
jgi:WhiB family redox-sensing transcriptional regulator